MTKPYVLAIDPGTEKSAFCRVRFDDFRPLGIGICLNQFFPGFCENDTVVIERITGYGQRVGAEVFRTCEWIGRFDERAGGAELIPRREVKTHICGNAKVGDSEIIAALRARFAPGVTNGGKGSKAAPGWFYGFRADIWQAYALAVCYIDQLRAAAAAARDYKAEALAAELESIAEAKKQADIKRFENEQFLLGGAFFDY